MGIHCVFYTYWSHNWHFLRGIHQPRLFFLAWSAPSHYLNPCWNTVNWTLRNKLQWNFDRNHNIFIQENAFESAVCETASILPRPQCVKEEKLMPCHVCSFIGGNECMLLTDIGFPNRGNYEFHEVDDRFFHPVDCRERDCDPLW